MIKQSIAAFAVYSLLSFTIFLACFGIITYFGIDQHDLFKIFDYIKSIFGIAVTEHPDYASSLVKNLPTRLSSPDTIKLLTRFFLAGLMTKLFIPLKLPLVGIITPLLMRKVNSFQIRRNQKVLRGPGILKKQK
jgi:hypothetical protein